MTDRNHIQGPLDGDFKGLDLSAPQSEVQLSGRWAVSDPDPLPVKTVADLLPTVRLRCLSEEAAQDVFARCQEAPRTGPHNRARLDGDSVIITYENKLWPYDIAEMAQELGLAAEFEAARVIACL